MFLVYPAIRRRRRSFRLAGALSCPRPLISFPSRSAAPRIENLKFLADLYARVQIDTPAESAVRDQLAEAPPPPPFASRRFQLATGEFELACWLADGPRPLGCVWCDELAVWMLLRRRVPVARRLGRPPKLRIKPE